METILLVLSIVLGIYEVLTRAIPSVKDYTILGNIFRVLKAISDGLNAKGSKRKK